MSTPAGKDTQAEERLRRRRRRADLDEALGEPEADLASDALLHNAGPNPDEQAEVLAEADPVMRARAVRRLQREHGNTYVQRMLAAAPGGLAVQRKAAEGVKTKPKKPATDEGAPAVTTGDIALVTGYLGRQIDNWHEGARQGCEQFWKWSQPKPGAGKDFWFTLAGNVLWAVGNSTTAGLVGIGIGAMQTYLSATAAQAKAEGAEKIYNEILTGINHARSEMSKEDQLELYAKMALSDPMMLEAVRGGKIEVWAPRVRALSNVPAGDDVNAVKEHVFTELLKKYWDANVSEVEVVYAAYQPQPMAVNIALTDWPEIAKLIRDGDTTWHIYKDKKIVGTQGGTRVEIPVDHPQRDKVEDLVRQLEAQALKD